VDGGEFEYAVEDEPSAAESTAVEAKHELVEVALEMGPDSSSLM
jgi:hypothetical protein